MSETILIASGKGGTGKTFVTANLGTLLAKRDLRVLLIDMDLGMRNLDLYLGLENKPVYNIMDVFSGICRIQQALIKGRNSNSLYFMSACPRKDDRDVTPLHMEVLCGKMKEVFDYVLIDCPAGIGEVIDVALGGADKVVLVTEPNIASVRDADVLEQYLRTKGFMKTYYILNKVRADLMAQGLTLNMEQISEMIKSKLTGIIQWDDNIYISTNKGIPITMKEDSYIVENFNNIIERLTTPLP